MFRFQFNFRVTSLVCGVLLLTFSCNRSNVRPALNVQQENPAVTDEMQQAIWEAVKEYPEHTELSFAIIRDGQASFYGVVREKDSLRSTDNRESVFEIGSLTKVFTAALLADYVTSGNLELSTPLKDLLPYPLHTEEIITLQQLANHSSGIPRLPSNLHLLRVDPSNPYKEYDSLKLKTYLSEKLKLDNPPGTAYAYSNTGTGTLGYALSLRADSSYEMLLQQHILLRYGMVNSTTRMDLVKGKLVKGRDAKGKETSNWDLNVLVGAGGLLSTVSDLSRFALAHFDGQQAALQLCMKPTFKINERMEAGLGWHLIHRPDGSTRTDTHRRAPRTRPRDGPRAVGHRLARARRPQAPWRPAPGSEPRPILRRWPG